MIKGISEARMMPRVGKIHLGVKDSERGYPKPVDWFVVKEDQSTPKEFADSFHKIYGEKPKSLNIMFPTDNVESIFPQFYRRYDKTGRLLGKGDGEIATELDVETGEYMEQACNPEECPYRQKGYCKPLGTLQFILPEVQGFGVWQIDTSSVNSMRAINSSLDIIKGICGRISGIPLKLVLKEKEVSPNGKHKKIYYLDVISSLSMAQIMSKNQSLVNIGGAVASPNNFKEEVIIPHPEEIIQEKPEDFFPDEIFSEDDETETDIINISIKKVVKNYKYKGDTSYYTLADLDGESVQVVFPFSVGVEPEVGMLYDIEVIKDNNVYVVKGLVS